MASPFKHVCPPCQPIGETDDGTIIFRSRKTPSVLPYSGWFVIAFSEESHGKLANIDTLYRVNCASRKVTALELHLLDEQDNELSEDSKNMPAIDKVRHSDQIHAIVLRWMCPAE